MAPRWYKDAVSKVRGTDKRPFQTIDDLDDDDDDLDTVQVDLSLELDDLESQRDDGPDGAGPSSSRWSYRTRSVAESKEGTSPRRDDGTLPHRTALPEEEEEEEEHRSIRARARSIMNPVLSIAHWKGLHTVKEDHGGGDDDDDDDRSGKDKDRSNPKMRRIAEARFSVIESRVDSLVNGAIKRAAKSDPWMPPEVSNALLSSWAVVWNETVDAMRDEYIAKHSGDGYREAKRALMDLSAWPRPPPMFAEDEALLDECECGSCGAVHASCARGAPERFLDALRARYLYALLPADKSIWWQVRRPLPVALLVSLVAPFGISTAAWFVFFLAIDRTDEYQLINWAILFKSVSFIKWGLLPLLTNYFLLYACASVGRCDDPSFGLAWGALDRLNTFSMSLFCFSWIMSWTAFFLYKRARESKRLAARPAEASTVATAAAAAAVAAAAGATGAPPGPGHRRTASGGGGTAGAPPGPSHQRTASGGGGGTVETPRTTSFAPTTTVAATPRNAQLQRAGSMADLQGSHLTDDTLVTRFMLWDVCSFGAIVLAGAFDMVVRIDGQHHPSSWPGAMLLAWGQLLGGWSGFFGTVPEPHALCFELMTCLLGLACVPFVLFKLPGLGVLVLRMRPTAYDQAGNLRLQLSRQRIKKKFDAEQSQKRKEMRRAAREQNLLFSCALQRSILLQGQMYVTDDQLHFSSGVGGKTVIALPFRDLVSISKGMHSLINPSIIVKTVADEEYIFASFWNRNHVIKVLRHIWSDYQQEGAEAHPGTLEGGGIDPDSSRRASRD